MLETTTNMFCFISVCVVVFVLLEKEVSLYKSLHIYHLKKKSIPYLETGIISDCLFRFFILKSVTKHMKEIDRERHKQEEKGEERK